MKQVYLLLFLLMVLGCSGNDAVVKPLRPCKENRAHQIYLINHGWHTSLVIPATELYQVIPALQTRFGATKQIELGWGDKGFYQANPITIGLTLRAILWPTESVIHAVSVPNRVDDYFSASRIEPFCVYDEALSALIIFIGDSFEKNKKGDLITLEKGLYGDSQFYQAKAAYHLMNTCNQWTAKGLEHAGVL